MAKTKTEKLAELEAERTSTNNKISGVKTQLKRIGGTPREGERRPKLEARLDELTSRRTELGEKIGQLRPAAKPKAEVPTPTDPPAPEPTPAPEPAPDEPIGEPAEAMVDALAGKTKPARSSRKSKETVAA